MTQEQINEIFKEITTVDNVSDGLRTKLLQMAAESITLSTLQSLLPSAQPQDSLPKLLVKSRGKSSKVGFTFSKKEMKEIPTMYKKIFACKDKIIPYRFHKGVYEAHYRGNGMNVFACAKDFNEMKRKFIAKLNELAEQGAEPVTERMTTSRATADNKKAKAVLFSDYVNEWLEVKKKTTKPSTFKEYERLCRYNLVAFDGMTVGAMTRPIIQQYLFKIVDEGKNRTASKLQQIMTCIFDLACDDLGITSPMKKIVLPYYEAKKGRCFTFEEEGRLVKFCAENSGNAASSALLVLLYFGLRKSELASISVEDEKLTCVTSKTRLGRGEVRRTIPFTPVFKRVLPYVDFERAKATNIHTIETTFKRLFPERHPHELRYTFITRCKECNVSGEVVMLWDGHSFDRDVKTSAIDRGYTTYSEKFLLKEAEKVDYQLPDISL